MSINMKFDTKEMGGEDDYEDDIEYDYEDSDEFIDEENA